MPALPTPARQPAHRRLRQRALRRWLRRVATGLTAAVAVAGAAVVAAPPATPQPSPLGDPTRPPAALSAPTPGPSATGRVVHPGTTPRSEAAEPETPPRLQSLRLPAHGPSTALIDGRMVKVGDRVGRHVVAAIDLDGVLLRSAAARGTPPTREGVELRLRLLGGDEKQPPGTIQITRSARWQPQVDPAEPAGPALAGASAPQRAAPVSVAERTHP